MLEFPRPSRSEESKKVEILDALKNLKKLSHFERMAEYRHHSIPLDILDDLGSVSI